MAVLIFRAFRVDLTSSVVNGSQRFRRHLRDRRQIGSRSPLFVDPNAVLPGPVPMQQFKPVVGRDAQKLKVGRSMQLLEFANRDAFEVDEAGNSLTTKKIASVSRQLNEVIRPQIVT